MNEAAHPPARGFVHHAYGTPSKMNARREILRYADPPQSFPEWFLSLGIVRSGATVLDIGCGDGAYLDQLKAIPKASVTGCDTSPAMVAAAAERTGLRVDIADAQQLPYASQSVDVALLMHMIYDVPQPERAVSEARRILRPGGTCVMSANTAGSHAEIVELLQDCQRRIGLSFPSVARFNTGLQLTDCVSLLEAEFETTKPESTDGVGDVAVVAF